MTAPPQQFRGEPVAVFSLDPADAGSPAAGSLVLAAFTGAGVPRFVLIPSQPQQLDLLGGLDRIGAAAVRAVHRGLSPREVRFKDWAGCDALQRHVRRALARAQPAGTLNGTSRAGPLEWVAYFPGGTERVEGEFAAMLGFDHADKAVAQSLHAGSAAGALLTPKIRDFALAFAPSPALSGQST